MNYDENSLENEFQLYSAVVEIEATLKELNELMSLDIVMAVRGVSAGIDAVKKLAELARKSQNVELRQGILDLNQQLLDAREALLNAKGEIDELKAENQRLKDPSSKLTFDSRVGMYFEQDDLASRSAPFCSGCYDKDDKRIRLSKKSGDLGLLGKYQCPVCKTFYQ